MKVLILCMAFAAVSLAMPVAEDKQEVPIAPPSVPEVKSEEIKPQSESQSAPVAEKKVDAVPDVKSADKPVQIEAKSADVPTDTAPEAQPEVKAEAVPEVKSSEPKPEPSPAVEPKPEEKSAQPESKPEAVEASKPEESPVKVEEVIAPAAKSAITEDIIDIVNAVKIPAAVADDVVDPAAINPSSDSQPIVSTKSAEDKKVEPSVSESGSVKASSVAESQAEEPKPDNKPVEVATASDVPAAPKSSAVSDDATRVIRDAIEEKKATETPQVEAKTVAEVIKDEVKPAEVQVEAKSAKPTEEAQAPQENVPEPPKVELPNEVVKEVKSVEIPKEKEGQEVLPLAQPVNVVKDDIKPEVKSDETIMNDAPAKEKNSSEESAESSEKNESTEKDSSEESGEKSKENAPKP